MRNVQPRDFSFKVRMGAAYNDIALTNHRTGVTATAELTGPANRTDAYETKRQARYNAEEATRLICGTLGIMGEAPKAERKGRTRKPRAPKVHREAAAA